MTLKLSGYQDWQAGAQVTAGQTTQLTATLTEITRPTPTPTPTGGLPVAVIGALGLLFVVMFFRKTR